METGKHISVSGKRLMATGLGVVTQEERRRQRGRTPSRALDRKGREEKKQE